MAWGGAACAADAMLLLKREDLRMSHRSGKQTDGRSHALRRHDNIVGYLFMLPALAFFGFFIVVPMLTGFTSSLFNYTMKNPVSAESFIGFQNYVELFQDEIFYRALRNTLLIVVVAVPTVTLFALWVASAITPMREGSRSFFRCVFYIPAVTGTVAVTVVWKWMFDAYNGIFNYVLKTLGLIDKNIMWLGDPKVAIWCIILILFTTSIGQPIVLYVAALGNVDASLVEAAEVDGATKLQSFWRIKWPSIMPTTLYVVIITTINSFQCFALIQLLTSGGPQHSTDTMMYYLYTKAFSLYRYGYANAVGVILALIIAVLSAIQFKVMNTDVEY
jgi:multiple sugar transport system permease protein